MNIAIILAGGVGTRAGFSEPKQFVKVLGRPVISYTIEVFERHPDVDAVEVVCVSSHMGRMQEIIRDGGFGKVRWICEGGPTFQQSVINGLDRLRGEASEDDIVLLQYGASPMVHPYTVSDAIRVCAEHGNASPAASELFLVTGRGDGESTTEPMDRDEVMVMNTPQALRYGYALWLYREAERCGLLDNVDPHTIPLMLAMGERVWFSEGSHSSIKLTRREDFLLFEGWLLARERRGMALGSEGSEWEEGT